MTLRVKRTLPLLCILPFISSAEVDNLNYITIKAGGDQPISSSSNASVSSLDKAYVLGIEAGRRFMDIFTAGIEYNYKGKSDININSYGISSYKWAVKSESFMFNVAMDLTRGSKFTPYIKTGLGASRNKVYDYMVNNSNGQYSKYPGKTSTSFAWQIGAGLNIITTKMIDTDLAYIFTSRGKISTQSNMYSSLSNGSIPAMAKSITMYDHILTAGIKVKF